MSINIISIVSIIIWIVLITELMKPSKNRMDENSNVINCWLRINIYFNSFILFKISRFGIDSDT